MRAHRGMRLSCLKRISASGSVLSFFHTTTCFITWHRVLGLGLGLGLGRGLGLTLTLTWHRMCLASRCSVDLGRSREI